MDREKDVIILCQNSNGSIMNQRLTRETIAELSSDGDLIAIFNDVRTQKAEDININGFSTILRNKAQNRHYAGGVCVLFPDHWTSTIIEQQCEEGIIVELQIPGKENLIIASCYNHPENYINEDFINKVGQLNKKGDKRILLMGDFNCAAPEFGSRTETDQGKDLVDRIATIGLNYLVNDNPTYISRSSGNWNILDLAFASDAVLDDIKNFIVGNATESDHLPLVVRLNGTTIKKVKEKTIRNWSSFKERLSNDTEIKSLNERIITLKNKAKENNCDMKSLCNEINICIEKFTEQINNAQKQSSRTIKIGKNKDFKIENDTKAVIKERRKVIDLIKVNKNAVDITHLKMKLNQLTNKMRTLLKRDKFENYQKKTDFILNTKDVKKKWQTFNDMMGRKRKDNAPLTHLKKEDGKLTRNVNEIVNRHAQRLKETHSSRKPERKERKWHEEIKNDNKKYAHLLTPQPIRKENGDDILESIVTMDNVINVIRTLKTNTAAGDDGVDNSTIKNLPKNAIKLLVDVYDICIQVGYFPDCWKRARIKMILKPGKPCEESSSYRPISLLSCVGKVLEKLIKQSLDHVDNTYKFTTELHAGFRPKRSTQECFMRLCEGLAAARKQKKTAAAAFIDIQQCFDKLDHQVIRYRFRRLPIPLKTTRIVSSFLSNRRLYVEENGVKSEEVIMQSGAPQGAILSPTIYTIYSHDAPLTNNSNEGSSLYADDTSTWTIGENAIEAVTLLQRRLDTLSEWCAKWNLHPAPTKTDILIFSNSKYQRQRAEEMEVLLKDQIISWKSRVKFLGVNIENNGKWTEHIDYLIKSNYPKVLSIAKLNRRIGYCDRDMIMSIFNSLIMSTFEYSCLAFLNMPNKGWDRIESFLTRSLKQIFELPKNMNSETARGIFISGSFRQKIENFAVKRSTGMLNVATLTRDMVANYVEYADLNGKDTILDRLMKISGVEEVVDCYMCQFNVDHNCVRNNFH